MKSFVWCFVTIVCGLSEISSASVEDDRKVRPPLVEESGRRKFQKQTHCQFGNQSYELEERWRPDLGPPFGTLYCMRCECIPFQRKKRIMSRVKCKDIKTDCPKPLCDNPILPPERCCKSCPGEDYSALEEDIATRKLESEDEDKMLKEFSVLLTGKVLIPSIMVSGAAEGHLIYSKKDLHYTIHYRGISRPSAVRFTSEEGNILEEHEIPAAPPHTHHSKVCGVWRKVPKVYRRTLLKERLLLVLVSPGFPEGIVGGRIIKHNPISTESYGALLVPEAESGVLGSGGMAGIFSVADAMHVSLGFNGIFNAKDAREAPVLVTLSYEDVDGRMQEISQAEGVVAKAHPDFNSATVKLDLPAGLQERLASGRFELHVTSKDRLRQLGGRITPKVTCNVFQAVMTASHVVDNEKDPATGFIILDIGADGFINYKLHVSDPDLQEVTIQLETDVETPAGTDMRLLQQVLQNVTNSWCNGTFTRRRSQEIEMMLADDLVVTVYPSQHLPIAEYLVAPDQASRSGLVTSEAPRMQLRGEIRQRLYTDALVNEMPLLLSGGKSSAGGMAWVSVDRECALHFQLYVTGLDARERHLLELLQVRPGKHFTAPLQKVLKRFDGEQVADVSEDLDGRNLAFLHAGYSYLVVTSKLSGKARAVQLRAKINNVHVPPSCLPRFEGGMQTRSGPINSPNNPFVGDPRHASHGGAGGNDVYGDSLFKCVYEDQLYDDGHSWIAEHQDCTMCACKRGQVDCESILCPPVDCPNPITIPNECCPFCPGNQSSEALRYCNFDQGDRKYHVAGSRWYPFVPPFGFSQCSVCTCEATNLTVRCEQIQCPELSCPNHVARREDSHSCCKKCPHSITLKSEVILSPSAGHLGDQQDAKAREILITGGCKFRGLFKPNGDEWHPLIEPYGVEKCVKCSCKDGKTKCRRKQCPTLRPNCSSVQLTEDGCCKRCQDDRKAAKKRKREKERRHRNRDSKRTRQ